MTKKKVTKKPAAKKPPSKKPALKKPAPRVPARKAVKVEAKKPKTSAPLPSARAKVPTLPCPKCGMELTHENRSILKGGEAIHVGCTAAPPPPEPKDYGDIKPMVEHGGRTCLQVNRGTKTVSLIPMDVTGLNITTMRAEEFDNRFSPLLDREGKLYPVVKACEHYLRVAKTYGASQAVLDFLGQVVNVTTEDVNMAKKNKSEGGEEKKSRGDSAAALFKQLIMEGKLSDDDIFKKVQAKFGLDDKKRGYVAWYRNWLKKNGQRPPEPVGGRTRKAPAAKGSKAPAAKGKAAKGKAAKVKAPKKTKKTEPAEAEAAEPAEAEAA